MKRQPSRPMPRGQKLIDELIRMANDNKRRGYVLEADVVFGVWEEKGRVKYGVVKGGDRLQRVAAGKRTVALDVTAIFCDCAEVALAIAE